MEQLPPPKSFSFDGNVDHEWKTWKKHFSFYLTATESDGKPDKTKTCILLSCIGSKGREIYETFDFNPDDENDCWKLDSVFKKFADYCSPKKNTTILRHKFFTHKQSEGQTFIEFVTELKTLSEECEFDKLRDSLIKDMIICGVLDNKLRERMLRDTDITLEKATTLGQAAEETKKHIKELKNMSEHAVNQVGKIYKHDMINNCKFCAGRHLRRQCPAFGKQCDKCKRMHHFPNCCFSRKKANEVKKNKQSYNGTDNLNNSDESSSDEFLIEGVEIRTVDINDDGSESKVINVLNSDEYSNVWNVNETPSSDWTIKLDANGSDIRFKIDTGAQCNVLPKHVYSKLLDRPKLKSTNTNLSAYNNSEIKVCGKCVVTLTYKNKDFKTLFIVADTDSSPLLGLQACERLDLIKRVGEVNNFKKLDVENDYMDCFGELGCLPRVHHMELKPEAFPVICPMRRIPYALKDKVNEELARMEGMGVIEKIEKPTEWLNTLVVVEKPNGKVRLCLDPRNLNKVIKREHYQIPTAESIMAKMKNAKYFTKLDASSGYWQIKVDEETSKLLAFMTPNGRYKFNRLPFGVHSASEIFQSEISQIISGIQGTDNLQDDIIVWGETMEEHNLRLVEVLQRIRESGLKLNRSKCVYAAKKVTFLGHIITSGGIKPDPQKTKAISDMPNPTNKVELQRFLGMINYLAKFIPDLATITAPLRQLLQKDVIFSLEKPQIDAVEKLKELVTSDRVLQFYNPELPLRLRTDASTEGLGAMIEQLSNDSWHPIAFASRSLTEAEKHYSPIEAETLSIVFGCERFREYVYGRKFMIQNDHQPLKAIFSKPITSCPPRIQRFFLRLQRYDFELEYAPGKTMIVADALSRASLSEGDPEIATSDINFFVHSIISSLPISSRKLQQLKSETDKDRDLQILKTYIEKGWPEKKKINKYLTQFFSLKEELSSHEGLLLKGNRIIIPSSMRLEIKSLLHYDHLGIEKCTNRARASVFWPNIRKDIEDVVSKCSTCLDHRNALQRETLIEHDIPDAPWVKVGIDLFSLYKKEYVVAVDYHSKYVEVAPLKDEGASCVINNVKKIFSRHGIPTDVFSDNGSQFTSTKFKTFSSKWDFKHDSSSPEYPKSNGFVERHIQTVKRTLKKASESNKDPYLALLYLNTAPDKDGHSPASLMFGRHPRTTLPRFSQPHPGYIPANSKVKMKYDTRSKDLSPLKPGTTVRIYSKSRNGNWKNRGKVLSKRDEPRSYNVLNEKGNTLRRNRWQLLPTNEVFEEEDDYQSDDSSCDGIERDVHSEHPTDVTVESNVLPYRTRYGRSVHKPDRYGYNQDSVISSTI